ncbi:MAG: hypothetical protein KUG77_11000, partial [Nannocystaceae bacterium]|nr:hypothetical protein [Nannocystaceae bacterium]
MRLRFLVPPTLAMAGVLATPSLAHAEDPTPPAESRAYMYLSPGVINIPVGDDDFSDLVDVGYEWGVGGGLMLAPAGKLAVGVGLGIHHAPLNADEDVTGWCGSLVDCDASFHLVRILPEIRVGRGFKHLFPYGYVAPGLAILTGSFTASAAGFTTDADDTD